MRSQFSWDIDLDKVALKIQEKGKKEEKIFKIRFRAGSNKFLSYLNRLNEWLENESVPLNLPYIYSKKAYLYANSLQLNKISFKANTGDKILFLFMFFNTLLINL